MKTSFKKIEVGGSFFDKYGDQWKKTSETLAMRTAFTKAHPFSKNETVIPVSIPKVLIYVKGGVAEFVVEGEVDVAKYDADDAEHDQEGNPPLPKAFKALAMELHLPVEGD